MTYLSDAVVENTTFHSPDKNEITVILGTDGIEDQLLAVKRREN